MRTFVFGLLLASALAAQRKQIDIGAAEAPLSDPERIDLDAAIRKHDYAVEKTVIDKARSEHPESAQLLLMAGRLAYLEKQPKDAADALAAADKIKPISEVDRLTLALSYQFSKSDKDARPEFLKLIQAAPKNGYYFYLMGQLDAREGHLEDSIPRFRKAIELDPALLRAREDLGRAQENLGQLDEARKTFEDAVVQNRLQTTPWDGSPLDLGVVLLKADELDVADRLLREALMYNPRSAQAHYYLGQVLQKRKKDDEAVLEFKAAVGNDPKLRQAWLALGREFTRKGDKAEADRALAIFKQLEDQANADQGKKN